MADLQVTQEVLVFLNSFHNVDLFQRGYYQVRCRVEEPSKLTCVVECEVKEREEDECSGTKASSCLFKSFADKYTNTGVSKTVEVYYKHEEVPLKDVFVFRVHMLIDSSKIESHLPVKLQLVLELFFAESSRSPATPKSLEHVSTQVLTLHLTYGEPYHAYRPVLFDYFHLGAVNITVHSSVSALRQPWLNSLKALHPIWSGKSGNVRQHTYSALFGKNSSSIQPSQKLEYRHKENASYLHRKLCLILLKLYENLLSNYHSVLTLLPDYVQMRLSKVDVEAKLEVLNNEFNSLASAEDIFLRMGDDLYLLSTELNMLWSQFTEQFLYEDILLKRLIDEHHILRCEHMKEAVFTQDHLWEALCSSLEIGTSQQARMFSDIKNSMYYQLIPPINLECVLLDGDCSTMPIIFEDKYIPGCSLNEERNGDILTVQESVVGDDFVDMDVSIQDSTGRITRLSVSDNDTEVSADHELTNGTTIDQKERTDYPNAANDSWELSKDKIKLLAETDLTGPDYCLCVTPEQIECNLNDSDSNNLQESNLEAANKISTENCDLGETNNIDIPDNKEHLVQGNSVFYTDVGNDSEPDHVSVAEEALLIEDLEIGEDEDENKTKEIIALSNAQYPSVENVIEGTSSPVRSSRPKLWSCFPTKGNAMKHSPYKVSMAHSQPYLPVPRKLSTRMGVVSGERQQQIRRFEHAKENLEINSGLPGHHYRLTKDEICVKPYFTERVYASTDNVHLVVCVHGLDGNSGDLRLVRCFLELASPRVNFDFLMSEVNQEDTFCDIDEMTQRLVDEILDYIEDQGLDVVRLSFVGHSLGNIIIRNAVVHSALYLFRNKLHTFLSLSGPHLGMQFHTSNLVSTGMWLMQKWKKCGSLVQLALNDSSDPRDSFMYRLSLTNGFQYFKNVLLVSSVQDHYVPFHSARVEMSKTVVKDNSEVGRVYKEMLDNILNPLMAQEEVNIVKYSVHHPMPSSPNTFIGRAAHIAMLDSELFLEKFILCIAHKYFE